MMTVSTLWAIEVMAQAEQCRAEGSKATVWTLETDLKISGQLGPCRAHRQLSV